MAGLIIKPRARVLHGHDWVYTSDILKTFGNPAPGDVLSLKDGKDRLLGSAIYNPASQIVARRFSRQRQDLDADFFQRRVGQAIEYRRRRGVNPRLCRLVWSESDGLPGVIVDRYEDYLVVQTLTLAMDQRKELLSAALVALLAPKAIIERNDAPVRRAEGMETVTGILHGEVPHGVEIEMDGMRFAIDPARGQKTAFTSIRSITTGRSPPTPRAAGIGLFYEPGCLRVGLRARGRRLGGGRRDRRGRRRQRPGGTPSVTACRRSTGARRTCSTSCRWRRNAVRATT